MSSSSSARKLCFLLLHLAAVRYHLGDQDYLTVSSILTVLLGTALTACNYWLWLCPMDRVRDVSHPAWLVHNILTSVSPSAL